MRSLTHLTNDLCSRSKWVNSLHFFKWFSRLSFSQESTAPEASGVHLNLDKSVLPCRIKYWKWLPSKIHLQDNRYRQWPFFVVVSVYDDAGRPVETSLDSNKSANATMVNTCRDVAGKEIVSIGLVSSRILAITIALTIHQCYCVAH